MIDAFIIMLRESAELLLICMALRACLREANPAAPLYWCTLGAVAGIVSGILLERFLAQLAVGPVVQASLTIVMAVAVLFTATGMLSSARRIARRVDTAMTTSLRIEDRLWSSFCLALLAGLRESLEASLFLHAIARQAGVGEVVLGAVAALVLIGVLCLPWIWLRTRVSLLAAFRLSTLLLLLLAVDLLVEGVGQLLQALPDGPFVQASLLEVAPFLQGGQWHGLLTMLLFAVPLLHFVRSWWTESGSR